MNFSSLLCLASFTRTMAAISFFEWIQHLYTNGTNAQLTVRFSSSVNLTCMSSFWC